MALNYGERAAAARDGTFIDRVTIGAVKLAVYVTGEAANTTGHAARLAFAKQVLDAPRSVAERLTLGVLTASATDNAAAANSLPDATIQTALETIWNAYAGVVPS